MAPNKMFPKAQVVLESRALDAGGGGPIREGYAFAADYDRYFALGYPFFRWVADGLPEDRHPEKSATRLLVAYHANEALVWPRETAQRVARAWGTFTVDFQGMTPEVEAALKVSTPIDAEDVRRIVERAMLTDGGALMGAHRENYVFLLEALVGPAVVADALLDRFELLERAEWIRANRSNRAWSIKLSGFLLLRMQPSERAARRARFEALYQRGLDFGDCEMTRALDILLNGAEGAERSCDRDVSNPSTPNPYDFLLVEDSAAQVRMTDQTRGPSYAGLIHTARHAYLGGDAVLDIYLRRRREWLGRGRDIEVFIETFGQIKNERIVRIIAETYAKTKAKELALQWLRDHRDYVRHVLSSVRAPWVAALLEKLA